MKNYASKDNSLQPEQDLSDMLSRILDENKGEDIVAINMEPIYGYESRFLIVTALSKSHLKKLSQEIYHHMKNDKQLPGSNPNETDYESGWVILDYGELVVHFFLPEVREIYNLEKLWAKADVVPWAAS